VKRGILYGIAAYALWGLFPFYWKLLREVPALQLLGHRIAWSFLVLMAVIFISRQWGEFRSHLNRQTVRIYLVAAVLIAINWLTYVWSVNSGFILEASLGYFINPLLSVLLGVIVLRERLRPIQWIPIGLAALGVAYLMFANGGQLWIPLTLALSFGFYGLIKKTAPLNSLFGLALETGILFLPALAYLSFMELNGSGAFLHTSLTSDLLMIGAGIVTTIPLLMFATAARQIPLSMVGILQYITPTLQFLIGVFVYHEQFDRTRLIGFGIVWIALIIFWLESYFSHRVPVEPVPEMGEG
jgi:chloramphenicol-sensitive protein RarD